MLHSSTTGISEILNSVYVRNNNELGFNAFETWFG